jgi:hypothetical protein
MVPEAGYNTYTGENQPVAEKQRRTLTNDRDEQLDRNFVMASGTIV